MSWELISSIMVITLPADYLAAMALPQGFPWVLQQLIFSVAGAPELEQHGRQLLCNRLEEGRESTVREGGGRKAMGKIHRLHLPQTRACSFAHGSPGLCCQAEPSLGCSHGCWAGWGIWVTFPK